MPSFRITGLKRFAGQPPASFHITRGKSTGKGSAAPAGKTAGDAPALPKGVEVGKAALFAHDGVMVAGVIAKFADGGKAVLRLAVPDEKGILMVSDSEIEASVDELRPIDAVTSDRKVTLWETNEPLDSTGTKGVAIKDDGNQIIDYKDVAFFGYGSTFSHVTPADRDGDAVATGAFTETIREFKRNPVMLIDHRNSVENIAGSYTEVMQDDKGLKLVGRVSNAPELRKVRFLIMEGHLKTLSMGGVFLYSPDGKTIEKVYLFEVSLVAVPANPDAIFQSRALDLDGAAKMFRRRKSVAASA